MPSSLALCPVPTASLGQLPLPPLLPPKLTVFQGKGLMRLLSCSRSSPALLFYLWGKGIRDPRLLLGVEDHSI